MTPTDCLKAGPAELAPIVAEMMGVCWRRFDHNETLVGVIHNDQPDGERLYPAHYLADAFRLQDRVAELGLGALFGFWMIEHVVGTREFHRNKGAFRLATASPLNRTRAACAAYLESKEPARGSNL